MRARAMPMTGTLRSRLLAAVILFVCAPLLALEESAPGRIASVNGIELYYEAHGSGEPFLLPKGAAAEAGFTPLFNGRDLTGWSGDPRLWRVAGGAIVGSTDEVQIPRNSFLSTERRFSDFVLRLEVKLRNHNSGVQFRSEQFPDYVVRGYQADIAKQKYFGMLYEEGKRGFLEYWKKMTPEEQAAVFAKARVEDWNDFEITCRGDAVNIVLNGATVCDIRDPAGAREGIVGLQLHTGAPMQVSFRNIRIRELK